MTIQSITDLDRTDHDSVGGKAASLGELTGAGLPVPGGFVVTTSTYRTFLKRSGVESDLRAALDADLDGSSNLVDVAERAQDLILDAPIPEDLGDEVLAAYDSLDGTPRVAVRSSATAEDLPDASFAGQQDSYLHVTRAELVDRIQACWASLFTPRAIEYRNQQGYSLTEVDIAVVVQRMIDADKSGVLFTRHPSSGANQMVIEATWGLGEAIVSGSVSPDSYIIDRADREPTSVTIGSKKIIHTWDPESGETVDRPAPDDQQEARVLTDDEIDQLVALAETVEEWYENPQDIEWAIESDELFMLQSRPITTLDTSVETTSPRPEQVTDGSGSSQVLVRDEVIVSGLGASPGEVTGTVRIITTLDELDTVNEGDIIVTEMTTPDMVPAMKRAAGIVTNEGGMTSHASIVSRELGVPAVVGTETATEQLDTGMTITIDGEKGTVSEGRAKSGIEGASIDDTEPTLPVKPMTATEVKVNVSIPEAAERAAATGADGVGLLRIEHMILSLGATPATIVKERGEEPYVDELVEGIRSVAEAFHPRPVRVRTLDAPTDEFRQLDGGENEPAEHNPMLGFRGIRRSLEHPDLFGLELRAFRRLYELGYDNVEIMFPLVNDASDVQRARDHLAEVGIDPTRRTWGVMIETPSSALRIDDLIDEGIDFASFGTNDLTQYTLAVDRNNERVANRFDELHPSVIDLIESTVRTCRERNVKTSICGQAGSHPQMVNALVNNGISSISANIDAVRDVQRQVKRVEQRLLLDAAR